MVCEISDDQPKNLNYRLNGADWGNDFNGGAVSRSSGANSFLHLIKDLLFMDFIIIITIIIIVIIIFIISWTGKQGKGKKRSCTITSVCFVAIVSTSYQLAEVMFFVFVNMCIVQGLARKEILKWVLSI